jgi:amidophosphoribosyltransferase
VGEGDPVGVRPLVLGEFEGAPIVASETCALDIIGATFVRDVEPGEMVICNDAGVTSLFPFTPARKRFCIFEYVYFARPDSIIDNISVHKARMRMGERARRGRPRSPFAARSGLASGCRRAAC